MLHYKLHIALQKYNKVIREIIRGHTGKPGYKCSTALITIKKSKNIVANLMSRTAAMLAGASAAYDLHQKFLGINWAAYDLHQKIQGIN